MRKVLIRFMMNFVKYDEIIMTKELRDAVKFLNETNIALCEDHEEIGRAHV